MDQSFYSSMSEVVSHHLLHYDSLAWGCFLSSPSTCQGCVLLSWMETGSCTYSGTIQWPVAYNAMVGQGWVTHLTTGVRGMGSSSTCPESGEDWSAGSALEQFSLKRGAVLGGKNSPCSSHIPLGTVMPCAKPHITVQGPTPTMSTSFRKTLPNHQAFLSS